MNPLAKLLLYAAAVLLLAALLSPPIYWAIHDWHPFLAGTPFRRFFSRTALIVSLALLWPALRWMNVRRPGELGLARNPRACRDLAAGLLLALGPLGALAGFYFGSDVYRLRKDIPWSHLLSILAATAVVPIIEELLFRGVLLGLFVRFLGRGPGLLIVSLVFAAAHFIASRADVADVRWFSGFDLLGQMFSSAGNPVLVLWGATALFSIGVILGGATLRTRSLWLGIGLHAGWILGQQTMNLFGRFRVKPPEALLPWIGPNVVHGMVPTGAVPLVALLVTGALVWWYLARVTRETGGAAASGGRGAD